MSETSPGNLILAMQNPDLYDHPVDGFQVIETHISQVILTGDYAYKIKKPMDFGFLNFSTLDRRKHFCEEELRLNRRLADKLYLEVVPITGTPDNPILGGEEKPSNTPSRCVSSARSISSIACRNRKANARTTHGPGPSGRGLP